MRAALILEVPPGFGPGNEGFADLYIAKYCGGHGSKVLHIVDFWMLKRTDQVAWFTIP